MDKFANWNKSLERGNAREHSIDLQIIGGRESRYAWYDSMLARWRVPCETLHVPTRHGDTFVIVSGKESAASLILLHGAGSNSMMWIQDVVEYNRWYRVYAIDLLGEPGKSAPNRPTWSSPVYAEWLEDVLDTFEIRKTTLIGFSQGGWSALKFAVNHSERVQNLVLLSPGGIVPDKLSFVFQALPLSLLGRWGMRRINRMIVGDHAMSEEVDDALTMIMMHFKPRVGALPIFTDDELRRLTMPVLLMMGAKDTLRDAEKIVARMKEHVPHLTAIVIPNGGHALLNTPEQILPFLTQST